MSLVLRSPRQIVIFLGSLVVTILGYHQIVHHAVSQQPALIAGVVEQYCKTAIAGEHRGPGHPGRQAELEAMAAEWNHCTDIRIESIAARGGLVNQVMVRVVLDRQYYLPLGKRVLVFKTIDYSLPFVGSLVRVATGHWTFNSHTTYSDLTYYGAI